MHSARTGEHNDLINASERSGSALLCYAFLTRRSLIKLGTNLGATISPIIIIKIPNKMPNCKYIGLLSFHKKLICEVYSHNVNGISTRPGNTGNQRTKFFRVALDGGCLAFRNKSSSASEI